MLSVNRFTSTLRMRKSSNVIFDLDVALPLPLSASAGKHWSTCRTSRWICLLATCIAFVLGVGVGVAVPFYVLPTAANRSIVNVESGDNLTAIAAALVINQTDVPSWEMDFSRPVPVPTVSVPYLQAHYSHHNKDPHSKQEPIISTEQAHNPDQNSVSKSYPVTRGPSRKPQQGTLHQSDSVQGIYWTAGVELLLPRGFSDDDVDRWQQFCDNSPVVRLDEGCGRMQNRLLTFDNGTRSCCRYRQNYDQIQGEIFSYYLGRLLGIRNLPPSALGLVRPQHHQWSNVRSQLSLAQWAEEHPVVLTQFLDHLEPAYIPRLLRDTGSRRLHPVDMSSLRLDSQADRAELVTLAQWSDLIMFDYLTANLDRMVNNLYNLQWNPAMMDSPAHNLARDPASGLLIFLDNESGLLHGYRLLDKYEVYHKTLLESVCVFRRQTVEALRRLQSHRNVGSLLRQTFESRDTFMVDYLPFLPEKSVKTLNHRIDRVLDQVSKCDNLYGVV